MEEGLGASSVPFDEVEDSETGRAPALKSGQVSLLLIL